MTTVSPKDLLFAKVEEMVATHQKADRVRSEMHCLIAALPGEEKPQNTSTSSMCRRDRPTIIHRQHDGHSETHMHQPLPENRVPTQNSPAAASSQSEVTRSELPSLPAVAEKPKKPRAKRMNPMEKKARTQEAILCLEANPHLNQKQVAIQHGLEPKALSRQYANKLKKSMRPAREKTPKDVADDYLYNEKRQKRW